MSQLGPKLASRPLHFFWLLDVSGSMGKDGKIEALNEAVRVAIPALRSAVADNPGIELLVRAIAFANEPRWHTADPVPISEFEWTGLAVVDKGVTEMGLAIDLVTQEIHALAASGRALPPALVLVSDGKPTNFKQPTFGQALRGLEAEPWGRKASRMAVGIGREADMTELQRFIGHEEVQPVLANNAAELVHYLRWASTMVVDDVTHTRLEATTDGEQEDEQAPSPAQTPPPPPVSQRRTDIPPPVPVTPAIDTDAATELPTIIEEQPPRPSFDDVTW